MPVFFISPKSQIYHKLEFAILGYCEFYGIEICLFGFWSSRNCFFAILKNVESIFFLSVYDQSSTQDPNASADPYYNHYDPASYYNNAAESNHEDPYYNQKYGSTTSGRKLENVINFKKIGKSLEQLWSKASDKIKR